jgi:hypothetical protein
MSIDRRRFLVNSLASAIAAPRLPELFAQSQHSAASAQAQIRPKPYGSGSFGVWFTDQWGLPAFLYTCDQINDPNARTDVSPGNVLGPTEHIHQVGNDRIIALASNSGVVRVRQDEGAPKFLNDYDPETSQYAGGIGWLTDGDETVSTYYSGATPWFERHFGVGYFRKKVYGKKYSVDQIISAPFGDDPVLLSQITVTNNSAAPGSLRWIEYWGTQTHEFSFRAFIESWTGIGSSPQIRRRDGRLCIHQVRVLGDQRGLLESRSFPGHTPQEDAAWQAIRKTLIEHPNGFISPLHDPAPGTSLESGGAPPTFLISLDAPATGFSTDGAAFFGSTGPANPAALDHPLGNSSDSTGSHTALLLERSFHLAPGESRTLHFLYGYLPAGFDLNDLIARYTSAAPTALQTSSAQWKQSGLHFSVASEPWVERETAWNHYYLRSSLTFDDYFGQHILNQNGYYQYVMGFQGAARDPLQHCLPFLFSDPAIVRSVLRYTLSEVRDDGSLPYGLNGHGFVAPMVADNASDLPLWLLWAVSEYVLATRDTDFLHEKIPARVSGSQPDTVANLLARCYRHQVNDVGVGQHGVCRMLADDWNDGLIGTWAQSDLAEAVKVGESVLNSAMSPWVFDQFARMLAYDYKVRRRYNDAAGEFMAQITATADRYREAARAQWTGKWLKRCWLGPTLGWLGESTLWIEPQPWAILAGVTTPDQTRALVATMNDLLRTGPIGAAQMSNGPDLYAKGIFDPGTVVRGGIWPSLNQTLVWALAGVDPAMAWDEWKKNSFAAHADAYPGVWYGVWSGTDSYNSPLSKHPGYTAGDVPFKGNDFPVLNLHSHACFLYSASKLLGIEFTADGLTLRPDLPAGPYRFESPLLGVARSSEGRFEGWYAPSRPGTWTLRIHLPDEIAQRLTHAEINGKSATLRRLSPGTLEFTGSSAPGQPFRWVLAPA